MLKRFLSGINIELELLKCVRGLTPRSLRSYQVRRRLSRLIMEQKASSQRSEHPGTRRMYVDIAVIQSHDAGTGIQRVVRAIALQLITELPPHWELHFVTATKKIPYQTVAWPKSQGDFSSVKMVASPGDVFIGLDFSLDAIRRHQSQLYQFKANGGKLWFLVHDLLAVQRPDWFSDNTVLRYKAWLDIIASTADGFLCNSTQTANELIDEFSNRYQLHAGFSTAVIPMGSGIMDTVIAKDEASTLEGGRFSSLPSYCLMVGTLEPRKGHADIISAFSELWKNGSVECLVLIGRLGWKVDDLKLMIEAHVEYGKKLFWFNDVSDGELYCAYEQAQGVIIGSLAEGFGLPLTEALGLGRPVLARDITVFRYHESNGVSYFPKTATSPELALAIGAWINEVRQGRICVKKPTLSWEDAARALIATVSG